MKQYWESNLSVTNNDVDTCGWWMCFIFHQTWASNMELVRLCFFYFWRERRDGKIDMLPVFLPFARYFLYLLSFSTFPSLCKLVEIISSDTTNLFTSSGHVSEDSSPVKLQKSSRIKILSLLILLHLSTIPHDVFEVPPLFSTFCFPLSVNAIYIFRYDLAVSVPS